MGDNGGGPARLPDLQDAHAAWAQFLDHALRQRLDPDRFAAFVPQLQARHPLGAGPVADLCLRPSPWNRYTLDPRMPLYLQTLLDLRLVDLQAVLAGLFRYSTAHAVVGKTGTTVQANGHQTKGKGVKSEGGGGGLGSEEDEDQKDTKEGVKAVVRWQSSFTSEEFIFYRLTKAVHAGTAIRNSRDAAEVCVMMARWMALFTAASAALPPVHDDHDALMGAGAGSPTERSRLNLDDSRAAFVMLLLGVCENNVVLGSLGKPFAKGMLLTQSTLSRPRLLLLVVD